MFALSHRDSGRSETHLVSSFHRLQDANTPREVDFASLNLEVPKVVLEWIVPPLQCWAAACPSFAVLGKLTFHPSPTTEPDSV